ncbi:MAG TPA: HD domain-containing phosphohydrolase [Gemmatimonadaceae bacterium]|jgi:response regulator RpfG family c-di-GMP phosphodiesterase|nr:HD domain-containing phosphohydrolase [Gemmatimonadaceae bacterium]
MGQDNPDVTAPHCVVVDDEAHLRRVLMRLMQNEGFVCHEAPNGRLALELLARVPATLLLSDLHMPELDGMGLLREVREHHPDTAVIMITAVADVATAVSALSVGAMDYLTKPFHLEEVRARVRQALEKRRLILENRGYQQGLEARVAEQARRIEAIFLASIQSLADALEVKDPYTHGHSLRVSSYSVAIAKSIGLAADAVREIEIGGHVHDIGKIGVREAVLNKPGPLTDEEYAHIMTHPTVGWRILSPLLGDVPMALNIVRWHHERYDGSGLPDGLVGDAIPIEARIAAVADTFDAMTSVRPYRPGVALADTLAELRRCSGAQFDPVCVSAFFEALESGAIDPQPAGAASH